MNEKNENSTRLKILLVDDEVNITKSLRRLLSQEDEYEIFISHCGEEGLAQIRDQRDIGVIISDQRMPQMTGVEFFGAARKLIPDAIRILLTGYADIEASVAAINQGAVFRYLTKPWQDDELLAIVADAAKHYRLVVENKRLNALVAEQNIELKDWNNRLKQRVLEQTAQIRSKSDSLAEKNRQLRLTFAGTIEALSGLIEMREHRGPGHSRNVAELVDAMAQRLALPKEEMSVYRSAALLHDIGKIGMSDDLLRQDPTEMNKAELSDYQSHAVRGQTALDPVLDLRDLGLLIRHHHENYDGSGFPDGLSAEEIPLGARLIAVADRFERKLHQFTEESALEEAQTAMGPEWGTGLDPSLRKVLRAASAEIFSHLKFSAAWIDGKVSPHDLEVGMRLLHDLFSGTGILLLKKGIVFDENSIEAVERCFTIDPSEREIAVLIKKRQETS